MTDPCTIQTCVSPKAVWWYRFFKWLVLGLMVFLLASLLGLRNLTRTEIVTAPRVPVVAPTLKTPSLSVAVLQVGDLMLTGSDGYVTGPINIAGLGLAGAIIQVRRDGKPVGEILADVNGDWSYREALHLLPGSYQFDVLMLGNDQAVIEQSEKIVVIIPKIAGDAPPSVSSGDAPPSVSSGDAPPSVSSGDAPLIIPVIGGINKDQDGKPLRGFFGRGRPNSKLEIVKGQTVLGIISVGDDGSWRCECVLPPGVHNLAVREVGFPERVSATMAITIANPAPPVVVRQVRPAADRPRTFCPDPLPQGDIQGDLYTIAACETLWRIATRLQTDLPTLMAYNPQIPDPNQVYAGQLLNIPTDASCSTTQ